MCETPTIILKLGYNSIAISYSSERFSALLDIVKNATLVDFSWNGHIQVMDPAHDLYLCVVPQEVPKYIKAETEPEAETETEPEMED